MAWASPNPDFSSLLAESMKALPGGIPSLRGHLDPRLHNAGLSAWGISAIAPFCPLLVPIVRQVGLHEVHYAMVAVLAIGISVFEPTFGEATLPSAESAPWQNETDCQLNDRGLLGILGRCGIVAINRILEESASEGGVADAGLFDDPTAELPKRPAPFW
jgi:hypothetical protein